MSSNSENENSNSEMEEDNIGNGIQPNQDVKLSDIFGSDNEEEEWESPKNPQISPHQSPKNLQSSPFNTENENSMGYTEHKNDIDTTNLNADYDNNDNANNGADEGLVTEGQIDDIIIDAEMPRVQPEHYFSHKANTTDETSTQSKSSNELYFVKLPNFLSVEPRPFDPMYYENEAQIIRNASVNNSETGTAGYDSADEEQRTRVKLRVENTIRWRYVLPSEAKNNMLNDALKHRPKESNAKIIKWSDGSMSLQLGSEYFDIYKTQITNDYNHLFVRQGTGLQGQAIFKEKLSFRPHSTNSITHRKMTLSLADRCSKTRKSIKVLATTEKQKGDPELIKAELYKKEEEKLRAAMKSQYIGSRKSTGNRTQSSRKYQRDDLFEPEDFYEASEGTSISAIKKNVMSNYASALKDSSRPKIYSSDSEEDYSDSERKGHKKSAKVAESDEE